MLWGATRMEPKDDGGVIGRGRWVVGMGDRRGPRIGTAAAMT